MCAVGETDKHLKEISCVSEVKWERVKEIGEADKPEHTTNLCGYTLNRRMWERGVCQGVRQEVSTAISAKVILGESFSSASSSDLRLVYDRGNKKIWLWMQRPRKDQVRWYRHNMWIVAQKISLLPPKGPPADSPGKAGKIDTENRENISTEIREDIDIFGRADGTWTDTSARGRSGRAVHLYKEGAEGQRRKKSHQGWPRGEHNHKNIARKSARGERKGQVGQHFSKIQWELSTDTLEYSKKHSQMRNDNAAGEQLSGDHLTGLMPSFHPTVRFSGRMLWIRPTQQLHTNYSLKFHVSRGWQVKADKTQQQGRCHQLLNGEGMGSNITATWKHVL